MNHQHNEISTPPPHVLIVPAPLQGHVSSMLNLAEILLCTSDIHVTILLSYHAHDRLLRHGGLDSRLRRYGGFRAATVPDGLPDDHPRDGRRAKDIALSIMRVGGFHFRNLMESTDGLSYGGERRRVTYAVTDGVFRYANTVLEEMNIPYVDFRTASACSFWSYFCIQELIDAGEIPLQGKDEGKLTYWKKKEMDQPVTSIPGMENILRRRDIPTFCRVKDSNDPLLQLIKDETKSTVKGKGFILNTFEDLESPTLDLIRQCIPNLFSIGPLHTHLRARLDSSNGPEKPHHSGSFMQEDESCMAWLDSQPPGSVIFVSFGSIATLTRDEYFEFLHGLVDSGRGFLWVLRPDSVEGYDGVMNEVPIELQEKTKIRGCIVKWAPQQKVLAHEAVGAFLTHGGWNSIMESIVMGVPMICWHVIADQTTNARFVSEVWKVGLDIKDTCDRVVVVNAVKEVMEVRRDEFLKRARALAGSAKRAVSEGGSSYSDLNRLVEFLESISFRQ